MRPHLGITPHADTTPRGHITLRADISRHARRAPGALVALIVACSLVGAMPASSQESPPRADVLVPDMRHLRNGAAPEWAEFEGSTPEAALTVRFDGAANPAPVALQLTQYDVRREWRIVLNGHDLGALETDEQRMTIYREIPPAVLADGRNELVIEPAGEDVDDVLVGRISLHPRASEAVRSDAGVTVHVADLETSQQVPARITIVDEAGALQTVGPVSGPPDHYAVRPGTIYAGEGTAAFRLPAGRYTIYASRGFEYGADSVLVELEKGEEQEHRMTIRREVPTDGWMALDPHVHTLTHSGHGDATAAERVVTLAAEGVELPVITEHNKNVDLGPLTASMGYAAYLAPLTGNEYTTPAGHFNVFPVRTEDPLPDPEVAAWTDVASELAAIGPPEVVVLNHPRDLHAGFRPFGPANFLAAVGRSRGGEAPPAGAMEVINSGAQQSDVLRLVRDWFGALNAGLFFTPVGSSDSHDVVRYLVGQGRTYVRTAEDAPSEADRGQVIRSFAAGEAVASFGLLPTITVDGTYGPGELASTSTTARVDAQVLAPSWLEADHVALYMNGALVREADITSRGLAGEKWSGTWSVDLPPHDVFLSVVALGPGHSPPFWTVSKPYQRTSPVWNPHVIGVTGAVWVDVDGDGLPTPARTYAERLVAASGGDVGELIRMLSEYDEAIAAQVAAELHDSGGLSSDVRAAAAEGPPAVRRGFESFLQALEL